MKVGATLPMCSAAVYRRAGVGVPYSVDPGDELIAVSCSFLTVGFASEVDLVSPFCRQLPHIDDSAFVSTMLTMPKPSV
jgi:hypothetical protein